MLSSARKSTEGKTMTLALAITFNAVLMLALIGALAFVMSHARRLKPHLPAAVAPVFVPAPVAWPVRTHRARRPGGELAVVRS